MEAFPLSLQQKHVWLLQQNTSAYRVVSAVQIEGQLLKELFTSAVREVVKQHEILHTLLERQPGLKFPLQVIAESDDFTWQELNLAGISGSEQQAAIEAQWQAEKSRTFNFASGPLVHLSCVTLSTHKHVLFITLPAMHADRSTAVKLVREIVRVYALLQEACEFSSDEACTQYVDFSEWQNELLAANDQEATAGKTHWETSIAFQHAARLPFTRNAVGSIGSELGELRLYGEANPGTEIIQSAQRLGVAPAVWLASCWLTFLWRLVEQPETLIIGYPFDENKFPELANGLGPYTKTLPLRARLTPGMPFSTVVEQVGHATQAASQYQEYFAWEAGTITCPFQFDFYEHKLDMSVNSTLFSLGRLYAQNDGFTLQLACWSHENDWMIEFLYDPRSLLETDVQYWAEQFRWLLHNCLEHPSIPIDDLEMLGPAARHHLLVELNQTKVHFSQNKCLHQLFAEQAERTPNNPAVVCEDQQLTFAELNARANQLAHTLQTLGVGPEVAVGICLERSLDMLIGLLGILKAGGAYIPLDPALPAERLTFMLADTQAPVLLTQQHWADHLRHQPAQILCLDSEWSTISQASSTNPASTVSLQNMAHILFTSGSTGKPKAVIIEHRQLLNYVNSILVRLALPAQASYALVCTFAADVGNTAILPPLCTGGCLHIISQERALSPDALADYFQRHPIDCLKIVPSHLAALLSGARPAQVLPRQRLVVGGEGLRWDLVAQIHALAPDCTIINHYAPTEATVGVLTYQVKRGDGNPWSTVAPLGRPIANSQTYILDPQRRPVPLGVPGELYIGGANLSRGYLNRPDLTAEKFIPNPFAQESQAEDFEAGPRLYKSGDLARYWPDGSIEFLGRIDHQVKIRGFRVELGEIEVVLAQHPAVRAGVVLALESAGVKRLVAFLTLDPAQQATVAVIRRSLQDQLPDYMIPAAFLQLETMPLLPNGKVDRRQLAAMPVECELPEPQPAFVAPRTAVEQTLAQIWREVIPSEQIGIHDNFFALGGDSIRSIQIVARANQAGIPLSIKQLFQCQTIAELSASLEVSSSVDTESGSTANSAALTPDPHTPPDFSLAQLDQEELEQVLKQVLSAEERIE